MWYNSVIPFLTMHFKMFLKLRSHSVVNFLSTAVRYIPFYVMIYYYA
jgi:hypothetical protein